MTGKYIGIFSAKNDKLNTHVQHSSKESHFLHILKLIIIMLFKKILIYQVTGNHTGDQVTNLMHFIKIFKLNSNTS